MTLITQLGDPQLDLALSRIIEAPRHVVWNAWTDRASLEQWWVPAPARCRVVELDLQPGGGFVTEISETGSEFVPHMHACFLAIDELERLVFTDALRTGWRPAEQPFITAIITLTDHPKGTNYVAHVMHRSAADRSRHETLGFYDGWGTVAEQLAAHVEHRA